MGGEGEVSGGELEVRSSSPCDRTRTRPPSPPAPAYVYAAGRLRRATDSAQSQADSCLRTRGHSSRLRGQDLTGQQNDDERRATRTSGPAAGGWCRINFRLLAKVAAILAVCAYMAGAVWIARIHGRGTVGPADAAQADYDPSLDLMRGGGSRGTETTATALAPEEVLRAKAEVSACQKHKKESVQAIREVLDGILKTKDHMKGESKCWFSSACDVTISRSDYEEGMQSFKKLSEAAIRTRKLVEGMSDGSAFTRITQSAEELASAARLLPDEFNTNEFVEAYKSVGITQGREFPLVVSAQHGRGFYSHISEAVNEAIPGQLILVGAGRYPESIVVDKNVTIIGSRKALVEGQECDAFGACTPAPAFVLSGPAAPVVYGFTLRADSAEAPVVRIEGGSRARLQKTDVSVYSAKAPKPMPLVDVRSAGTAPHLLANRIHGAPAAALAFRGGAAGLAERNAFEANEGAAVFAAAGTSPAVRKNTIKYWRKATESLSDQAVIEENEIELVPSSYV